jgi:nitrogen regulation protein NR(I)
MKKSRILLIEDDASLASALQSVLASEGYEVQWQKRGDEGLEKARTQEFVTVVTDLRLPGLGGLDLVRQLHAAKPHLPIILTTAHGTAETAIEAMKSGAFDYLLKPFEMPVLIEMVSKAAACARMVSEPLTLGDGDEPDKQAIIGRSRAMQEIYKEIGRVAAKPVSVLIRGDTGTGKELIARALYQHSDRAKGPFIAINCAAIPETLLESELFGHERGAFTGAEARRIGRFEQADNGTIFLDEIGDMTPGTQVKLLRVLQEKTIQRLGGRETIPVDVRVIAATNRDLEVGMRGRMFREDLFYRLSVVVIHLPSMRERREDVPDLVRYFLRRFGPELGTPEPVIQPEALSFLQAQSWPGNVRELENVVRKVLLISRGYPINVDQVRVALGQGVAADQSANAPLQELASQLLDAAQRGELEDAHARLMAVVERELLGQAIRLAQGNQAKAARWLGISRLTLREKLNQFGLHPSQESAETAEPQA